MPNSADEVRDAIDATDTAEQFSLERSSNQDELVAPPSRHDARTCDIVRTGPCRDDLVRLHAGDSTGPRTPPKDPTLQSRRSCPFGSRNFRNAHASGHRIAVIESEGWVFLLGGMTSDARHPAIQMRRPEGDWLPVGSQMREARINPDAVRLPDGRIVIWGGFGGSARDALTPHLNGEILQPKIAGESVSITPPVGSAWTTPSPPKLLPDGTIGLIAQGSLTDSTSRHLMASCRTTRSDVDGGNA